MHSLKSYLSYMKFILISISSFKTVLATAVVKAVDNHRENFMTFKTLAHALLAAGLLASAGLAQAETVRWARSSDVTTLDPMCSMSAPTSC